MPWPRPAGERGTSRPSPSAAARRANCGSERKLPYFLSWPVPPSTALPQTLSFLAFAVPPSSALDTAVYFKLFKRSTVPRRLWLCQPTLSYAPPAPVTARHPINYQPSQHSRSFGAAQREPCHLIRHVGLAARASPGPRLPRRRQLAPKVRAATESLLALRNARESHGSPKYSNSDQEQRASNCHQGSIRYRRPANATLPQTASSVESPPPPPTASQAPTVISPASKTPRRPLGSGAWMCRASSPGEAPRSAPHPRHRTGQAIWGPAEAALPPLRASPSPPAPG